MTTHVKLFLATVVLFALAVPHAVLAFVLHWPGELANLHFATTLFAGLLAWRAEDRFKRASRKRGKRHKSRHHTSPNRSRKSHYASEYAALERRLLDT
ncbi:hypothetical protein ACQPXB_36175 [Amycolatopsis sp. CA-161197]|uniref:hypothetical protein n=1 Tax=Amycolatopsis sp. CA-161197 TaxID=3239922 RepID=UPI003D8D2BFB